MLLTGGFGNLQSSYKPMRRFALISIMIFSRSIGLIAVSVWFWCEAAVFAQLGKVEEFVGSIPCDLASRDFVRGISTNVPCHCITWRLTLSTNLNANQRTTYRLAAQYGLQGKADPNQLEEGPIVELDGEWEMVRGSKAKPGAEVYRLYGKEKKQTVSLVRIGRDVLHFLNDDGSLRIGNAGWSYTLNRKEAATQN